MHKYKFPHTNKNTQINKYKFAHTNTNTQIQIQIHKYTNTQIQIRTYKYKYTNTNTNTQIHIYTNTQKQWVKQNMFLWWRKIPWFPSFWQFGWLGTKDVQLQLHEGNLVQRTSLSHFGLVAILAELHLKPHPLTISNITIFSVVAFNSPILRILYWS